MKNFNLIIIISIIAAFNMFGEELPLIDYNWSEITIPNNERIDYNIITNKNDMLLITDKSIYFSSDYGKNFKRLSSKDFNFDFFIHGYNYDSNGGLYLILDFYNVRLTIDILYIPVSRDTIIEFSKDDTPSIWKKYLSIVDYNTYFNYLIDDSYLLIGTDIEVFLFNVQTGKFQRIKYFDDIINDLIKKDSLLNGYNLHFLKFNRNNKRVEAYLTIGKQKLHIYSDDICKSWDTLTIDKQCEPLFGYIGVTFSDDYNDNNQWVVKSGIIDDLCNFKKINSFSIPGFIGYLPSYLKFSCLLDNCFIMPADKGTKIIVSYNLFESFFLTSSIPYKTDSLAYVFTQISKDGVISLIVCYKDPPEYTTKMYIGSPATSVDDFQDENNGLYPNPATDYITINPGNKGLKHFAETDEQFDIYNSFGELVMQDVKHLGDVGHLIKIDVSHLPVGLYFVKIGNRFEKFVKM